MNAAILAVAGLSLMLVALASMAVALVGGAAREAMRYHDWTAAAIGSLIVVGTVLLVASLVVGMWAAVLS